METDHSGILSVEDIRAGTKNRRRDYWAACEDEAQGQAVAGEIFINDSALTSAILDRLLHHAETQVIEGAGYRMKDQLET